VVRRYLAARWRATPYWQELGDASQEVFVECFKKNGALGRCGPGHAGGFRAFLYVVVRHVALRVEARLRSQERQLPDDAALNDIPEAEEHLSQVFDHAWATALVREARRRLSERARRKGEAALRRVELLRLLFHEGLPIREIALRWHADAAALHHEYERARQEFKMVLWEVVQFDRPGPAAEARRAFDELLELLRCKVPPTPCGGAGG
jgi:RNA polymerase sigma-70 factor (ECF subfamily)